MKLGIQEYPYYVGHDLLFRHVAMQVSSAQQSLTSVFGMGTGGPSAIETLTWYSFELCFFRIPFWVRLLAAGAPSGIRTRDPLIKSQLLYQLS